MATTILALGHAFETGDRGKAGGAATKDSVWGIAQVGNTIVTFSGRRTAKSFRFSTHKKAELAALKKKFQDKLVGKGIWYSYRDVSGFTNQMIPDIESKVQKGYYKAVAEKKLNIERKVKERRDSEKAK